MKILFVAFANSIHTARWINQITDQGWQIRLFPSTEAKSAHPALDPHISTYPLHRALLPLQARIPNLYQQYKALYLSNIIRTWQPDIIHSMEFQHSCYLTLTARNRLSSSPYSTPFPKWIVQNWGSDIYLFDQQPKHRQKIEEILSKANYYGCETVRDANLAILHNFANTLLPILPNTGGLDLAFCKEWGHTRASLRKTILLKGYQGWAGRALVGIQAIQECANEIQRGQYHISIYSAQFNRHIIEQAIKPLKKNGLEINIMPHMSHQDTLKLYGRSRIYIGLSISDAIPTSLTEAMALGAYPIQSNTGCAHEWLSPTSGHIVPPESPSAVAAALRAALRDNDLVDRAQSHNWHTIAQRLDAQKIRPQVIQMYKEIYDDPLC